MVVREEAECRKFTPNVSKQSERKASLLASLRVQHKRIIMLS